MSHARVALTLLSLSATFSSAQARPSAVPRRPPKSEIKIVAGVLDASGSVHYLPRVYVRLMSAAYGDAEQRATATYKQQLDSLRTEREAKLKELASSRAGELAQARATYEHALQQALSSLKYDPADGMPTCIAYERILNRVEGTCDTYVIGQKVYLSTELRQFISSSALVGEFNPLTFSADRAPAAKALTTALLGMPAEAYERVPEFQKQFDKALAKERDHAHLKAGEAVPEQVSRLAVARFVSEWGATAKATFAFGDPLHKYSDVTPEFVLASLNSLEMASKKAVKAVSEPPLKTYIESKDSINGRFDSQQAMVESRFRQSVEAAARDRDQVLDTSKKTTVPLQEAQTSLQGEAVISAAPGRYVLFAEDTTTPQHLRWRIAISPKPPAMIELTDANAQKETVEAMAEAVEKPKITKAGELTDVDRAELNLRYGSRLVSSWQTNAVLHDARSTVDDLEFEDSPNGFAFRVRAASTSVFNTLRMSDNDIAARFFKEIVAPYVRDLPKALSASGASKTFEAVTLQVIGSKKSFAEEYAVGDYFTLTYNFKLADVSSFAEQKIDAQQLLDRGHITHDTIGRINVRLVGGQ